MLSDTLLAVTANDMIWRVALRLMAETKRLRRALDARERDAGQRCDLCKHWSLAPTLYGTCDLPHGMFDPRPDDWCSRGEMSDANG